jgi:Ras-related protein Rab-2A
MFTIKDRTIKLQIWDTAGQESFKSITRAYYKGSIAAILVYDITSEKSFTDLNNWLYEIKNHSHQKIHVVLVGNKKDLSAEREVPE